MVTEIVLVNLFYAASAAMLREAIFWIDIDDTPWGADKDCGQRGKLTYLRWLQSLYACAHQSARQCQYIFL